MIRLLPLLLLTAATLNASFDLPPSPTGARQQGPRIASDGVDFCVVWLEVMEPRLVLVAQRITAVGEPLGPRLELFSTAASLSYDIAYGGGLYVITWADENGVSAIRITQLGTLPDREPVTVRQVTRPYSVAIAADRNAFVIAWAERQTIYTSALSFAGTVTPPAQITPDSTVNLEFYEPTIASSGDGFLLAWTRIMVTYDADVFYGQVVERTLLDSRGLPIDGTHHTLSTYTLHPAVASSGQDYLLVSALMAEAVLISRTDGSELRRYAIPPAEIWRLLPPFDGPSYRTAWDGSAYRISSVSPTTATISILRRDSALTLRRVDASFELADHDVAANAAGVVLTLAVEDRGDLPADDRIVAYTDADTHLTTLRRRSVGR